MLDIASRRATGSSDGLVVSARMKGNVERTLGRGELANAAIALILRPKSRSARPAILAAAGRARRPTNLLRTRSRLVGVARIGRTVHFANRGGGLENIRRIEVKTFEELPRRGRRARASDDIRITEKQARFLLGENDADARRDRAQVRHWGEGALLRLPARQRAEEQGQPRRSSSATSSEAGSSSATSGGST